MIDISTIDEIAFSGYQYADGKGGIPSLADQFEIDCFNAGISNYNAENNTAVRPILEGMKKTYIDGCNNGIADKEIAIVGV